MQPSRFIFLGSFLLFSATLHAQGFGVNATGSYTTDLPNVVINKNGDEIVDGTVRKFTTSFQTGGTLPQTTYYSPLDSSASDVNVTYLDENNGGIYTDSANVQYNFLGASDGQLFGWIQAYDSAYDVDTQGLNHVYYSGNVLWQDQVVVRSSTLATGTPVTLSVSWVVSGNLSVNGPGNTDVLANFQLVDIDSGPGVTFQNTWSSSQGLPNYTQTATITAKVGSALDLYEQLNISGDGCCQYSDDLNISDAYANIQDATAGTYLTSASGIDYSTLEGSPVPLPSTLPLLCLGMAGIVAIGTRRRLPPDCR